MAPGCTAITDEIVLPALELRGVADRAWFSRSCPRRERRQHDLFVARKQPVVIRSGSKFSPTELGQRWSPPFGRRVCSARPRNRCGSAASCRVGSTAKWGGHSNKVPVPSWAGA